MTWTFWIPLQPPSANAHVVNGNHAATAARYRKLRDGLAHAMQLCATHCTPRIAKATGKRLVTLTRTMGNGQRELDYDNWVTACKPLIDGMKPKREFRGRIVPGLGWLVDDSPQWVTVTYNQERAADGKPGTRVEISDVEGP